MKPKVFTSAQLAQYAAVAVAEGRAADVLDYWFELGEMIAAFAAQTRGEHFGYPSRVWHRGWKVDITHPTACSTLCEVCDWARQAESTGVVPLPDRLRVTLRELADHGAEADPVVQATVLLAHAALARAHITSDWAGRGTAHLLQVVQAVAMEFEASWPPEAAANAWAREDPYYRTVTPAFHKAIAFHHYARGRQRVHRDDEQWLAYATIDLDGDAAAPAPGEVERAVIACSLLAQGRLLTGRRLATDHTRYARGSFSLHPARPLVYNPDMRILHDTLNRLCARDWWLGFAEFFEFVDDGPWSQVGIAAWRKDRFPSKPVSVYDDPWSNPAATRDPPDWVCDGIYPDTLAEHVQSVRATYARAGIPWYWLVDPQNRVVRVLHLVGDKYRLVDCAADPAQCISLPPFDFLELDLRLLFPDPQPPFRYR